MMNLEWTMLSMVNANRFINMGAIPLVVVVYAVFVWIDHTYNRRYDPDIEVHIQNIKNNRSVDALVFGGSNAVYSLSAETLSYNFGANWYNASLEGELNSINQYKNFVRDLSTRIDRTKVRYVVYSSQLPYAIGEIAAQTSEKRVKGEGIKPKNSVLGYVVQYISGRPRQVSERAQRNSFGDIVFESVECAFTEKPEHNREEEDTSADFLVDEAIFFASVFPNASILIVLPSQYYGVATFDDSIFEQNLRTKFYGLLHQKYHFEGMVKIIFQPPYSSITQVCDVRHHANEDGRLWRTRNLIELMR
jgi:hypothetical protein